MGIARFEDLKSWQEARKLVRLIYSLTKKNAFKTDYELRRQSQAAAVSTMGNIACPVKYNAMRYVYVLLSLKDKRFYTGYTEDLKNRLEEHLLGKVSSTRNRRPLELVYYEACLAQADALHREKYLKTTWGKRYLRSRLKSSLKFFES